MPVFVRISFIFAVLAVAGCTAIKTEHHITLDHNITIRIEKEVENIVEDIFSDFEAEETKADIGEKPE